MCLVISRRSIVDNNVRRSFGVLVLNLDVAIRAEEVYLVAAVTGYRARSATRRLVLRIILVTSANDIWLHVVWTCTSQAKMCSWWCAWVSAWACAVRHRLSL